MAVAAFPGCAGVSRLTAHPWMRAIRCSSSSSASPCPPSPPLSSAEPSVSLPVPAPPSTCSSFPKRGQTLELVCESLAFKGKGVCKVSGTGFVVMCDRALPGERFLGRLSRKKGNYAEFIRDKKTGFAEVMVNFVTSSYKPEMLEPLVGKISTIPQVVSVMNNVNSSVGNTSVGEQEYTLYGKSSITEVLRGLTFHISANSFFQTNSYQADVLYELIEDFASLKGDQSEIVLDLFCGTGTIGLTLARRVRHVYGYEVIKEAVSDARQNAVLNGIHNATYLQGDLNKIDDDFGKDFPRPDIVISDPNRPGMHLKLIKYLLKLQASRIIYISCNPATCSRDLDYLCHGLPEKNLRGCYQLKSVRPVDMFPHTPHIECICVLELC